MTDRPIIFSGPMVRALLDGRKTQTRRKLQIRRRRGFFQFGRSDLPDYDWTFRRADHVWEDWKHDQLLSKLPYVIGDRLWVRESHYLTDDGTSEYAVFAQDTSGVADHFMEIEDLSLRHPSIDWSKHLRLRPSIHMPRWASRLTLIVTDVRVQRLQDIRGEDCIAEGVECETCAASWSVGRSACNQRGCFEVRQNFRTLWQSLHGPDPWDQNPWIVAISFDVLRGNIDDREDGL